MEPRWPRTDLHSTGWCASGLSFHVRDLISTRQAEGDLEKVYRLITSRTRFCVCFLRGRDQMQLRFLISWQLQWALEKAPHFGRFFRRWKWTYWQLHTEKEKGFKILLELLSEKSYCWRQGQLISILQMCSLWTALGLAPLKLAFHFSHFVERIAGFCFIAPWQAV